ncbi:MAG: RNA-binding protein [Intestinibacillus sp.]
MKTKAEILRALAQTEEDRVLLAQALDKLDTCRTRGYQTNTRFLDLRERTLVAEAVRLAGGEAESVMAGGYPDAERVCTVFYPDYLTAGDALSRDNSPLAVLRAAKHPADTLTHRDYLGALMGLQVKRECVGDIVVHDEGADLVVLRDVADFLLLHFDRAGRKRLTLCEIAPEALRMPQDTGEEKEGSVASLRLDAVTAMLFGLSRAEAQEQIAKGQVFLNFLACQKPEKEVCGGDRITLRGMGRARITALSGISRKGRQFLRYACSR